MNNDEIPQMKAARQLRIALEYALATDRSEDLESFVRLAKQELLPAQILDDKKDV
jgi:hypothetical protein